MLLKGLNKTQKNANTPYEIISWPRYYKGILNTHIELKVSSGLKPSRGFKGLEAPQSN